VGVAVVVFKRLRVVLLSGLVLAGVSKLAYAETLVDALIAAYRGNPTLNAERARLRATDEQVPQALSGWRPTVTAAGNYGRHWSDTNVSSPLTLDQLNLNITLNQPLFRGFKTVEGTKVAEANVKAGRQQLLATEQSVLFNAVSAYANVVRDRQILVLRRTNVSFLQKQLSASNSRFQAGELTRTDVAQSRASLSGAQGSVAVALANLKGSEANYLAIVGHEPHKLVSPRMAKGPHNLDSALSIAQETNPAILAAAQVEDAAEHTVEVIKGDLLPTLSLQGSLNYNTNPSPAVSWADSASFEGVFSIPLYEAGRTYSGVRQAKQIASQNRLQVIGAVRSVRENVSVAWNNVLASQQSLVAVRAQLSASRLALDGVQQEYLVGSRTTIDVLNARQALLNSQVSEVSALHDQVVASYQLQSAMGHLTAEHLGLHGLYDPTENYDHVRNKWIGLKAETIE
jgi:outer membrane protein